MCDKDSLINLVKILSLHNPNLLLRQPVELVHQLINRCIRRLNLPGQQRLLMLQFGVLHFFIEVKYLCDERNHAIVAGFVRRIGEVDGADGEKGCSFIFTLH